MSPTVSTSDNKLNLSSDSTGPEDILRMNDDELKEQLEGFSKFEELKKNSSKNRMDSFRGNISKLDTHTAAAAENYSPAKVDSNKRIPSSPWNKPTSLWSGGAGDNSNKKDDGKVWQSNSNYLSTNFFTTNNPSPSPQSDYFHQVSSNSQRNQTHQKTTKSNNNSNNKNSNSNNNNLVNKSRNESELCGLKVHYRKSGTESSSEDDDADVVVEEEYNDDDYNSISNIPVNVSQFLSSPVQSPPRKNIQPTAVKATRVKSPSKSPLKQAHDTTIERIKKAINRGDKIIIFMRGLPGSGKSTAARNLISTTLAKDPSIYIFSTDDFFQLHNRGVYKYDPTKLSEAHSRNHSRVLNAMKSGRTPIIVDNTNLQIWEMRPYVLMAINHNYGVEVLEMTTPWAYNVNELTRKNTHGVPKEKVRMMLEKYEKGITGKKLLDIYSSDFNPIETQTRSPTVDKKNLLIVENINQEQRIEDKKVIQDNKNSFSKYLQSLARPEVLIEVDQVSKIDIDDLEKEKTEGVKTDDSQMLQPLGAIGSERKNSVVHLDVISPVRETDELECEIRDNISMLPPCWDFTLLLDGKTLHSNHLDEEYYYNKPKGSPVDADEIRKQDEEFSKEGNSGKESPLMPEEELIVECAPDDCSQMDEFIKTLTSRYNQKGEFDGKESTVIITEIVDGEELPQLPDNTTSSDEVSKDCVDTSIEVENIHQDKEKEEDDDGGNDSDDEDEEEKEELHTSDEDVIGHGELKIKIPWPEDGDIDSEFLDDSIDDTIGDESLSDDDLEKVIENSGVAEKPESAVPEVKDEISVSKEIKKAPSKSTIGSIFNIIKTSILGDSSVEKATEAVSSNVEKKTEAVLEEAHDEKDKIEEISKSPDKFQSNEDESKEVTQESHERLTLEANKDLNELITEQEMSAAVKDDKVDNINSITWRESPFPLDDVPSIKLNLDDSPDKKSVSTNEAGTNTSYYDFNVSFVGGTADSNYRVLETLNRSINEGVPLVQSERPPVKLMLDKGSMTGDMFNRDADSQSDDPLSGISQLVDLFPHIPRDYLIEIYENLCQKDFGWAVDVLLDGVPEDMPIKLSEDSKTEEEKEDKNGEETKDETSSCLKNLTKSSADFLDEIEIETTEESLQETSKEDISNEEEEVSLSVNNEAEDEEIKLQECESLQDNKTDTDLSDDISSHSTASCSHTDSTENDKSSESEETIEFNLGFDGIRSLENLFSNSDFHIPDGFMPVIQVKKSMAKELYALWIESMYQQLNSRHEQLDNMIAKDAEYAKSLEKELQLEEASASSHRIQSMNLELALKNYNDAVKSKTIEEIPDDMTPELSRQKLYESLPGIDPKALDEILIAHGNNLKETYEIIKDSTGRSLPVDITRKLETFVDVVKEKKINDDKQKSQSVTPIIVVRPDSKNDKNKAMYKGALSGVNNAKQEAHRQFSLQVENFNKAAEAYRRGCPAVAAYYSQVSRQHAKNNEEARAEAASAMVEAQILDNEDILDLHNLVVADAIVALDKFLEHHLNKLSKSNNRYSTVYIVTGRGARSSSKMSRIKPAVAKKLLNYNIRFSEANPGCLKVTLHRSNGAD
ncbi:uncharacterized protein LOC130666620 isoform X2 [Microplitis mediator]|nr:uncharacterized protein LOC130666620 isoform X2 [Microplitis mediator]